MAITQSTIRNGNGITFTIVVDSSSDWSGVTNSTYFKDLSDGLIYYKNSSGIVIGLYDTFTGGTINGLTATTISATTYQNLPPSTDYYVTGGTYNYTGGTVTLNRNDGNDVSITGFNYNDTWTVELINVLSVDVYAPYNLAISSTTNILGSPTITLYDDNVLYSLGSTIAIGSKITIVASVTGVTNLNILRV